MLDLFSAYRAEIQRLVEYALILTVVTVLAVAAFTVGKPLLVGVFAEVGAHLLTSAEWLLRR